jgi:hypothetical protein
MLTFPFTVMARFMMRWRFVLLFLYCVMNITRQALSISGNEHRALCLVRQLTRPIILTFRGPCIVSIFWYISNKIQRYTVYWYLETALHVSGGISTHHQEHTQLYLQHLALVKPLLLPAAIVEELERSSNSSTIAVRYSCVCSWWWVEIPPETCRAASRYK